MSGVAPGRVPVLNFHVAVLPAIQRTYQVCTRLDCVGHLILPVNTAAAFPFHFHFISLCLGVFVGRVDGSISLHDLISPSPLLRIIVTTRPHT